MHVPGSDEDVHPAGTIMRVVPDGSRVDSSALGAESIIMSKNSTVESMFLLGIEIECII